MTKEVKRACQMLVGDLDESNPRFRKILCAALACAPVREALEQAIEFYVDDYATAKEFYYDQILNEQEAR